MKLKIKLNLILLNCFIIKIFGSDAINNQEKTKKIL